MHRLDRITANTLDKPAKLPSSKSLTLGFRVKQIWPAYLCFSSLWQLIPLRCATSMELSNATTQCMGGRSGSDAKRKRQRISVSDSSVQTGREAASKIGGRIGSWFCVILRFDAHHHKTRWIGRPSRGNRVTSREKIS